MADCAIMMNQVNEATGDLLLMNAHDLQAAGIPRALAYQLLNRADMPVITLGRRKFMVKAKFEKWLDEQSGGNKAI